MALTDTVHRLLREHLHSGDQVIDATLGNGHDTLFLASQVGAGGHVYGFDIQIEAITNTRKRLADAAIDWPVDLFLSGHESMAAQIPAAAHGRIRAVLFNLGYLPGGDKGIITQGHTSLAALEQARRLLAAQAVISVLMYRGHPGGEQECAAIMAWSRRSGLCSRYFESERVSARSPCLLWLSTHQTGCN